MANSYLESIQQARKFVQDHREDWEAIDKKVLEIVSNAQKITSIPVDNGSIKELNTKLQQEISLRKELGGVVEGYKKQIASLQAQLSKLSKTEGGRKKQLTDEERQLRTLQKSEERLIDVKSKHWKQIEANRQAANQESRGIRNRLTTYGQYSQQLLQMTKQYKDLAIQKARLNNLTAEETKKMDGLETQITQLRAQLVQVDHTVGDFGRSVGSYGKQFDSLGFSMAQITREMPAFAYGAQIGFAALSNNIPMLFDEIKKVKVETAALRAEGKAATPVLKRLALAVVSWQTLLSIGVTLLTLYGEDLIEWGQKMTAASGAVASGERALRDYNKAVKENIGSTRVEIEQLKSLISVAGDENATRKQRNEAVQLLQQEYPDLLANLTTETTKSEEVAAAIDKITEAVENRAKVQAAEELIGEKYTELLKEQMNIREEYSRRIAKAREIEEQGVNANSYYDKQIKGQANLVETLERQQKAALLESRESYDAYANQLTEIYKDIPNLLDILGGDSGAGGATDATEDQIKAVSELREAYLETKRYSIAWYEQTISALKDVQNKVARSSEEWGNYQKAIEQAQKAIQRIQDIQQYARDELAMSDEELEAFNLEVTTTLTMKGIEDGMERISNITGESLEDLYSQMLNWYGSDWEAFLEFSEAKLKQKEYEAEKIKEIQEEIVDEAVKLGSAIFEAEIERIDQRIEKNRDFYAQVLASEELTEERRAALEAERDLKERRLLQEKRKRENEQFLFEQGVALARVAMHTAVAYAEALPNLILANLIAVLGGIQAATIIAQSIPKFEKGTENAPEGWAIVDEVRPEVHTDKHGNVKTFGSDKGSNLRFLEQGDRIYRSREEYLNNMAPNEMENVIWNLNMEHQGRSISESSVNKALINKVSELIASNDRMGKRMEKLASRPIHNNIEVTIPDNKPY